MANVPVSKSSSKGEAKMQTTSKPGESALTTAETWQPFASLRHEIDRLFEDFAPGFGSWPRMRGFSFPKMETIPKVDLSETTDSFTIRAELPGMDDDDVEVTLGGGMLTIKGEKSEEKEHKEGEEVHWTERTYGSFRRSFRIPSSVDDDKIDAEFKNGMLCITLPKSAESKKSERKIDVKS